MFRYQFSAAVDRGDIESTLLLAVVAAECLHGETLVRLDGAYGFEPSTGDCTIDPSGDVGRDLNRLFAGFAAREFGPDAFRVERLKPQAVRP